MLSRISLTNRHTAIRAIYYLLRLEIISRSLIDKIGVRSNESRKFERNSKLCMVTLLKKKKGERKRKKQRSFVADRGETVENKDCRDGDPRGAAEDKSIERGHATDRGIAPIALGARSGRGCKRSGGRVSEQFLKRKEKKSEERRWRRRRGTRVHVCFKLFLLITIIIVCQRCRRYFRKNAWDHTK